MQFWCEGQYDLNDQWVAALQFEICCDDGSIVLYVSRSGKTHDFNSAIRMDDCGRTLPIERLTALLDHRGACWRVSEMFSSDFNGFESLLLDVWVYLHLQIIVKGRTHRMGFRRCDRRHIVQVGLVCRVRGCLNGRRHHLGSRACECYCILMSLAGTLPTLYGSSCYRY